MPKKILLADDSVTIRKVISLTLTPEDYELVAVGDGQAAILKAREIKPDLILADIAMPGKNGYEVCEIVKNDPQLSHIPVLLLSGTFETLDAKEAERVGADDHIVKPFESQDHKKKMGQLLSPPPGAIREEKEEPFPPPAEARPPQPGEIWRESDFIGDSLEEEREKEVSEGPGLSEEKGFLDLTLDEEESLEEPQLLEEPLEEVLEDEMPVKPALEEVSAEQELSFEIGKEEFKEPPLEAEFETAEKMPPGKIPPEEIPPGKIPPREIPEEAESIRFIEEGSPVKEKAQKRIKEALTGIKGLETLPGDKLSELIANIAREVIEDIAWEVVPELAEEIIKKELVERIRQSMSRP